MKLAKDLILWMISRSRRIWNFCCILDYLIHKYSLPKLSFQISLTRYDSQKTTKKIFYGLHGPHSLYVVVVLVKCDIWALWIGQYRELIQYWCIHFLWASLAHFNGEASILHPSVKHGQNGSLYALLSSPMNLMSTELIWSTKPSASWIFCRSRRRLAVEMFWQSPPPQLLVCK